MPAMTPAIRFACAAAIAFAVFAAQPFAAPTTAQASEVAWSVNGQAITTLDVQQRTAFLRLQGKKGGSAAAAEEMIDQALMMQEAAKMGVRVSQADIDASFNRFASANKLSTKQLTQILGQAGVSARHFKEYIRAQMTGGQVVQLRARQSGDGVGLSRNDIMKKIIQQGDNRPTSTEYVLQQVIFVIPPKEKGRLAARKKEAANLRSRFQSCDTTRAFAKGLIDVTVRDLGRTLTAELPPEWKDEVVKTNVGGVTEIRTTERGVEFLAICRTREVSDDKVSELQIRTDVLKAEEQSPAGRELVAELRKKAQIIKR
jgi:peptidyl-prolyl cis-trans isomerase SurA